MQNKQAEHKFLMANITLCVCMYKQIIFIQIWNDDLAFNIIMTQWTVNGHSWNVPTSINYTLTCFDSKLDSSLVDCESASTSCRNVSHAWNNVDWQAGRCGWNGIIKYYHDFNFFLCNSPPSVVHRSSSENSRRQPAIPPHVFHTAALVYRWNRKL